MLLANEALKKLLQKILHEGSETLLSASFSKFSD